MATPKKKHLIELMIEANVKWPDGAKYAAQDKNQDPSDYETDLTNIVSFYTLKPTRDYNDPFWCEDSDINKDIKLPSLCRNWHQTIVTREQYEQALADAAVTTEVQTESKHCEPVVSHVPDRTIEQLADDYYTKAAEAECLQYEADAALKLANEALITLQKAGEVIGLVISVDPKPEQPVITDWRDLKIGDVIECVLVHGVNGIESKESDNKFHGAECRVIGFINTGINHIKTDLKPNGYYIQEFKFIRRP